MQGRNRAEAHASRRDGVNAMIPIKAKLGASCRCEAPDLVARSGAHGWECAFPQCPGGASNKLSCRAAAPGAPKTIRNQYLLVIFIGKPPFGRNVSLSSGHTVSDAANSRLKFLMTFATTRVASWRANAAPMQMRGPAPNGR